MKNKSSSKKNPLIKIIEMGLELWIRSKCNSIHEVNIGLNASALELLSGKLSGVKLIANDVNFQDLPLHYVEISSGKLQIKIDPMRKAQKINLEKSFEVNCHISITNKGLDKLVSSKTWKWIGRWLAKELLEAQELAFIHIYEDTIEINGWRKKPEEKTTGLFKLGADTGKLIFINSKKGTIHRLPMDPSIYISCAIIKGKEILLDGYSKVIP